MNRSIRRYLTTTALVAVGAGLALGGPATSGAAAAKKPAAPKLITPKNGAVVPLNSLPTFKVRDKVAGAKNYKVFITIGTSKQRDRYGSLVKTDVGTFTPTVRKGNTFTYTPPVYTYPTWFLARPGAYYWQAYRNDCIVLGCHINSKIHSFTVQ